jgi:hypothetical protein
MGAPFEKPFADYLRKAVSAADKRGACPFFLERKRDRTPSK